MPFQRLRSWFSGKKDEEGANPGELHENQMEKGVDAVATTPESREIDAIENDIRKRFIGCFLGLAIGDAKGMPAESKDAASAKEIADCFDYLPGYLPAGSYTDDTHQSIMVAETLTESGEFSKKAFLDKLMKSELHRGIGPTSFTVLQKFAGGHQLEDIGVDSNTNGSAMRVAPLALLYHHDLDALREQTIKSSEVTHKGTVAIAGALSVAFAVAYMLNHYQEKFDKTRFTSELVDFIKPYSAELADSFKEENALYERYGCHVLESVPHAIRIFMSDPYDFEKAIQNAIAGGGDADTIASMVGAISGTFNGLDKIPQQWIDRLENSPKGRDYIRTLAEKLYEMNKDGRKNRPKQESAQP